MSRATRKLVVLSSIALGFGCRAFAAPTPVGSLTVTGSDQSSGAAWDTGAVTATLNGISISVPYGQYSTPAGIASALGALITHNCNMPVYAKATGTTVNLYTRGTTVLNSATITSTSSNPAVFASNSFLVTGTNSTSPPIVAGGPAGTIFSYDISGNIATSYECLPSGCGNASRDLMFSYTHDYTGALTSESDGSGVTYTYARSLAGEVTGITSSLSDANNPPNIIVPNSVQNTPFGPTQYAMGNGTTRSVNHDVLGRNTGAWICNNNSYAPGCGTNGGAGQLYGYNVGWSGNRATASSDSIENQNQTFGYDEFNRLTSFAASPGQQTYQYAYDRWGNRLSQSSAQGGVQTSVAVDKNTNRITGTLNVPNSFTYDAAGNLTSDGVNTYTYDAEGNVTGVTGGGQTAAYTYDSLNHRVRVQNASGTLEYAFNASGQRVSTWSTNGAVNETMIYWDGQPIGFRSAGATHFQHQNWLGTERLRTSANGSVEATFASLPFGDGLAANGPDQDQNHFAGLDADKESNTQHAQFRQYASTLGRWTSPDPYDGSYDLNNPQSLNRYTYVFNDPLSGSDPLGLKRPPACEESDTCPTIGGNFFLSGASGGYSFGSGFNEFQTLNNYFASWTTLVTATGKSDGQTLFQFSYLRLTDSFYNGSNLALPGLFINGQAIQPTVSVQTPNEPSYLSKVKCNLQAETSIARQDGLALGLDGAGYIPGEGAGAAVFQYGVATTSAFNSAFHSDGTGFKLGSAGALIAIVSGIQSTMGPATWAKAIPIVGYIANTAATLNDVASAYGHGIQAYSACINH